MNKNNWVISVSGEPADVKADESTLPEVKVYETPVPGGVARLLYTDRGAQEAGGEETLLNNFKSSAKDTDTVVLIASDDILDNEKSPSYVGRKAEYLDRLFSPYLGSALSDISKSDRMDVWQKMVLGHMSSEHNVNQAYIGIKDFCPVNFSANQAEESAGSVLGNQTAIQFALKHEFGHCSQNAGRGLAQRIKMESGADSQGLEGENARTVQSLLFLRSREVLLGVSTILGKEDKNFFSWGQNSRSLDHATPALIDPKSGKIDTINDSVLKKSMEDLQKKIERYVHPAMQENSMSNIMDDIALKDDILIHTLNLASEAENQIDAETSKLLPNRKISFEQKELYDQHCSNINDAKANLYSDIQNVKRFYFLMSAEDRESVPSNTDLTTEYKDLLEKIKEKGLDLKYPDLANSLRESIISRENLVTDVRIFFESIKTETPDFYKNFITRPPHADEIRELQNLSPVVGAKAANTAMYNAVMDARQQGVFANDPIQQRVVDTFLNGVHSNPDQFDLDKIKAMMPEPKQEESVASLPQKPPAVSNAAPPL